MKTSSAKSAAAPRGLVCPRCGCRHFELVKISHAVGYVRRRRACRHCGHRVTTTERIVGGANSMPQGPPADPI
jgi:DNA-directed RNA polymerase subunit RPC12/RpoP